VPALFSLGGGILVGAIVFLIGYGLRRLMSGTGGLPRI
jgi:hypothetical protein